MLWVTQLYLCQYFLEYFATVPHLLICYISCTKRLFLSRLYAFFLQIFSLFTWNPGVFFLLYLYSFSFSSKSFHPIIRRGKRHPLTKKQNKQMKSSLRLATDLRIVVNPWNLLNSSVDPILMSCNSHSGFCLPPLLSDLSLLFILFTLKLVFCWSLKNCLPAFM